MSNSKILIVHPDADVISLMTSMLQTLGHRIVEAIGDRVALRLLEQERGEFDLVLAGVDPFDPDALELLSYIRRKHPKTLVILVFPHLHADRAREATRRGEAAVLKFPVPATQLRAAVAHALGQVEESPSASVEPPRQTFPAATVIPTATATAMDTRSSTATATVMIATGRNGRPPRTTTARKIRRREAATRS